MWPPTTWKSRPATVACPSTRPLAVLPRDAAGHTGHLHVVEALGLKLLLAEVVEPEGDVAQEPDPGDAGARDLLLGGQLFEAADDVVALPQHHHVARRRLHVA